VTVFYFWEGSFSRTRNIFATLLVRMIGKNLNFFVFNIWRWRCRHKRLKGFFTIKICFSLISRQKYSFKNLVVWPTWKRREHYTLLVKNVMFLIMCALDNIVLARGNNAPCILFTCIEDHFETYRFVSNDYILISSWSSESTYL